MKVSKRAEKIIYTFMSITLVIILFMAAYPKKIIYASYRDAFVVKKYDTLDLVYLDDQLFFTNGNVKRKRLSIIKCRRRFKVGLFSKKEIEPECGI